MLLDRNSYLEIEKALNNAFIDNNDKDIKPIFSPAFLYNSKEHKTKVITTLLKDLSECDEFFIAVAFITKSGLQLFKETFEELKNRGIKGKILTTDYLTFTDPDALLDIKNNFPNIEVKMYKCLDSSSGFHIKSYVFKKGNIYKLVIGSSNMTDKALTINEEWNTKLVSTQNGEYIKSIKERYDKLFSEATSLDSYIETYEKIYNEFKSFKEKTLQKSPIFEIFKPNTMQVQFVNNLKKSIENGDKRGLLISATGTGKTYASAFGVREIKPKKLLFVAHRSQLLLQAISTFHNVLPLKKIALFTGDNKLNSELKSFVSLYKEGQEFDILFATIETIYKDYNLTKFNKKEFDFIIIDEVHKAGSETYRKLINYFDPNFLLGMSATPERTDDASKIYEIFNHNVIYEIRLKDALEYDLLCPFHYYGITDIKGIDDETYSNKDFNKLYSNERIKYIIKKSEIYGHSGKKLKGLIFVSTKEDGKILENKLNEFNFKVKFLSGENSNEERESAINLLESDDKNNYLDYIITVDIFNEGVDIPSVNQIIMLRPTISSIIFIQQLGRGLRKSNHKDYVVILDFIGNYENNYMIPRAFSENGSKVDARVVVTSQYLPGASSIEFDEIAKERIFASIQKAKFDTNKSVKMLVKNLISKLNRIPKCEEFYLLESFDMTRIYPFFDSYYELLLELKNDNFKVLNSLPIFNDKERELLIFLSADLGQGTRIDDLIFFEELMNRKSINEIASLYNFSSLELLSLTSIFKGKRDTYRKFNYLDEANYLKKDILELISNNPILKSWILDLIEFYKFRFNEFYKNKYKDYSLSLYEKYSYKDVCRLLNYSKDLTAVIGGYKYNEATNTYPIFINYEKNPKIDQSINYADSFINKETFSWESKKNRKLISKDFAPMLNKNMNTKFLLFIRKDSNDKESKKFFFLGEIYPTDSLKEVIKESTDEKGKTQKYNYVDIIFKLDKPCRDDIYNYLVSSIKDGE